MLYMLAQECEKLAALGILCRRCEMIVARDLRCQFAQLRRVGSRNRSKAAFLQLQNILPGGSTWPIVRNGGKCFSTRFRIRSRHGLAIDDVKRCSVLTHAHRSRIPRRGNQADYMAVIG